MYMCVKWNYYLFMHCAIDSFFLYTLARKWFKILHLYIHIFIYYYGCVLWRSQYYFIAISIILPFYYFATIYSYIRINYHILIYFANSIWKYLLKLVLLSFSFAGKLNELPFEHLLHHHHHHRILSSFPSTK